MPTVREGDGLAMSSRNIYLSKSERKEAPVLYGALAVAAELIKAGEGDAKKIIKKMREKISEAPSAKIDYVSIVDTASLENIPKLKGEVLVAVAARIGKTRLIDNIILDIHKLKEESELEYGKPARK